MKGYRLDEVDYKIIYRVWTAYVFLFLKYFQNTINLAIFVIRLNLIFEERDCINLVE